ncbi:MAG TPA: HEAT repeat domain-containing protein [Gaiellaceae bacterium]|nr:HEAT repeat domain-containing protein [Gaiellaceae bacterium]
MVGTHPGAEEDRAAVPAVRAVRRSGAPLTQRRLGELTLQEAAAQAQALAEEGKERELAGLRSTWADELESAARSRDYRDRIVAYRAIGQFRFRQKTELLRRGIEDESPACRGSALMSLELLSREHPGLVNTVRPLLQELAAHDDNQAVRRLAVLCLKNGSPQRETIVLLSSLADDDEQDRELRAAARKIAEVLRKREATRR